MSLPSSVLTPSCPGEIPAQLRAQVPTEDLPAHPRSGRGEHKSRDDKGLDLTREGLVLTELPHIVY